MASLNKAQLIGNLGANPEMKYTPDGKAVTSFSLATNRKYKVEGSEELKDETTWHKIVTWGKLAETVNQALDKGAQVYVEGRIRNSSNEDAAGVKHYYSEIVADKVIFLGSKPKDQSPAVTAEDVAKEPAFLQ